MAEIVVERKPRRRGPWSWIVLVLVLIVAAWAAWIWLFDTDGAVTTQDNPKTGTTVERPASDATP